MEREEITGTKRDAILERDPVRTGRHSTPMRLAMKTIRAAHSALVAAILALAGTIVLADSSRDRTPERHVAEKQGGSVVSEPGSNWPMTLPAGARVMRDVPYGSDRLQRFDVYIPANAKSAPMILIVHGGAWFLGDKEGHNVVANKAARWLPQGFIVVSTNYRMLPEAEPVEQARDVARALAAAQDQAASWGGDRARFILMGHSAGAHLVALLDSSPSISAGIVSTPWLGAVALDTAALDVTKIMQARHAHLYDRAFGRDPAYWKQASPFYALTTPGRPILLVCSTRRKDSCPQAAAFAAKASSLGMRADVLKQDLSHMEINAQLGKKPGYTRAVETFFLSLGVSAASAR
jgi:arylformamidase